MAFIDHPGLGWHNAPYPGLDRRGMNAALNFFFIQALDAHANVLDALGQTGRPNTLRSEADAMRVAAEKHFYSFAQKAYVDGYYSGKPLEQISQQTNVLAVISGVCGKSSFRFQINCA